MTTTSQATAGPVVAWTPPDAGRPSPTWDAITEQLTPRPRRILVRGG